MYLSLIFDIVIALILVLCVYFSAKKGFLGASYKFFSIILALLLMFMFQNSISIWIKSSPVGQHIETTIYESLTVKANEQQEEHKEIPEDDNIFSSLGLPKIYENIFKDEVDSINQTKENIVKNISSALTDSLINIISVILLYIVIRILLFLLYKITNFIFKLPVLKTLNKFLGAFVGLVQGLFIVYVLCALLVWFAPKNSTYDITKTVDESLITQYFYNNNLLIDFFIK